ncbi:MAG: multiple sugar transport system permease protein [Candidatus Atribacteria bacterium]|uniref:carbohydrate ABC transporter permease n=1 Tax=Atrimonas thermophila TaxID=3064161 RepID=UPI0024ABCFB9|nr:multiple sugar transport system permease protein [Candidatus Atribacteria bacterium]
MVFKKFLRKHLVAYAFLGPATILLIVLLFYPIVLVVWNSFLDNSIINPSPKWVGLRHYRWALADRVFSKALKNTLVFTISSVALHLIIGLGFALLLNASINRRIQTFFRVLLILPWTFTVAIVAIIWRLLLDPLGVVNYLLSLIGLIKPGLVWFGDPQRAMQALILANTWGGYPFIMVSLLAGLQGIPVSLYEAGTVDGANSFQKFLYITLPQLKPVILSIGLLDFIWTYRLFELIWLTTGGGPGRATETLGTYIYKLAFTQYQFSRASAVAVILALTTLVLAIFYLRAQKASE